MTFRDTDEPVLGLMGKTLVFEEERFHRLVANLLLHCAEVSFGVFSNWYTVASDSGGGGVTAIGQSREW